MRERDNECGGPAGKVTAHLTHAVELVSSAVQTGVYRPTRACGWSGGRFVHYGTLTCT